MSNQASEDEPINQHLVCLWQLQDIEETIADASPEELADLHSKLVALSTDITEAVLSAIRNEKLKLLADVREQAGEYELNMHGFYDKDVSDQITAVPLEALTKLEAEL